MAVRAILVDDHTMFREGLVSIGSSCEGGIEVLVHSPTGEEPPRPSAGEQLGRGDHADRQGSA
jgi:DNA-binding NarL/FixJ family response regulator